MDALVSLLQQRRLTELDEHIHARSDSLSLRNADGYTLLLVAVSLRQDVHVLQRLIAWGADVQARGMCGESVLHVAISHNVKASVFWYLIRTVRTTLMDQRDWYGNTPLHTAVKKVDSHRSLKYVLVLLGYSANTDICNTNGQTALHTAMLINNAPAVRLLLSKCSPLGLNQRDKFGRTALYYCSSFETAKLTISHCRDVFDFWTGDHGGFTCLQHLLSVNHVNDETTKLFNLFLKGNLIDWTMDKSRNEAVFYRHPVLRAQIRWKKLRMWVRGRDFPWVVERNEHYVRKLARTLDPRAVSLLTGRELRQRLRALFFQPHVFCTDTVNATDLYHSTLRELPVEFVFLVEESPAKTFFFDVRTLVDLHVNPYTRVPFSAAVRQAIERRMEELEMARVFMSSFSEYKRERGDVAPPMPEGHSMLRADVMHVTDAIQYVSPSFFLDADVYRVKAILQHINFLFQLPVDQQYDKVRDRSIERQRHFMVLVIKRLLVAREDAEYTLQLVIDERLSFEHMLEEVGALLGTEYEHLVETLSVCQLNLFGRVFESYEALQGVVPVAYVQRMTGEADLSTKTQWFVKIILASLNFAAGTEIETCIFGQIRAFLRRFD